MDPRDESEIVCVAITARCNRSGPRFPFHDISSDIEKRTTKIFSHDRRACVVVNRASDESAAVRMCNDASFVAALLSAKANRSRRDGYDARARSLSPATSQCALALALHAAFVEGQLSRPGDEHRRCVHFPEDGVQVREAPRGTCVRKRWGVSDPLRSGCRVRFPLRGGGRSRPGNDVDRPRGGPRRHKAPPTSGRAGTCMIVLRDGLRLHFFAIANSIAIRELRRQHNERWPIEVLSLRPLSRPPRTLKGDNSDPVRTG
jgi:hypothetical protein